MKFRRIGLVALASIIWLSGCLHDLGLQPTEVTRTPVVRPVIDEAFVRRIDGSTATIPMMTTALQLLRGTADGLHFNTTPNAYENLINGSKDIIFVTAPSSEELDLAASVGVELEVVPVVKDALVFLANTANPVDGLSDSQIKGIYTGQLRNWNQVGGSDRLIIPYQRPLNSGSQTLFLQLAMGETIPMEAPVGIRPGGMDGLMDVISAYDNSYRAIGYSVFYYTQEMYVKDNVKLLAVNGVEPSRQTIADGSYPYGTHYFAVIRSHEPADSTARQLIEWALTWEGQQTFSAASYVPLDPINIVPANDGYGYQGSTPENTGQSSGTGGPKLKKILQGDNICQPPDDDWRNACLQLDQNDQFVDILVPQFSQAEAAARAWLTSLPEVPKLSPPAFFPDLLPTVEYQAETRQGLLIVQRTVGWIVAILDVVSQETAIFRLSDGHRMGLSDFFYDGVNYIEFINRHLLNESTNQSLVTAIQESDSGFALGDRAAPFTGLPSTWLDFSYSNGQLIFRFPVGNPFLSASYEDQPVDSFVPINLPSDLSPYGVFWRVETVTVGGMLVDHMVSVLDGSSSSDQVVNQAIDNWVKFQKKGQAAVVSVRIESGRVLVFVDLVEDAGGYWDWIDGTCFDYQTGRETSW